MSGAGRSTIAHAMEDAGWYVIDNLPPSLLANLFDLTEKTVESIAVVVDVRGRQFFDDLNRSLAELVEKGISRRILFVDASDDVLVRRFESTRRPHPLQGNDRIVDGIAKEREKLRELRSGADLIIDSTDLNIHQLEKKTEELFHKEGSADLKVNVLSFGYVEQETFSHQLNFLHKIKEQWLLSLQTNLDKNWSASENFSSKNYQLNETLLNPKLLGNIYKKNSAED